MNLDLLKLRLAKLSTSLCHPNYWGALASGVAPAIEHRAVLRSLSVDGVIDVGANRGQFTLACRFAWPGLRIVAFEPIPAEAVVFRKVHGRDQQVQLIESALGESRGEATLHLSKSADSSSLLPIGKRQIALFKNTAEVGTLTVSVNRLDDFAPYWNGQSRLLLKLDVQGFELSVLRGALETLRSCAYVYAECSEVALYEGQALRPEVESFLQSQHFTLKSRGNCQYDAGELIQADYLFARENRLA
jgi:FkbM family methyltransferase